MIFKVFRYHLSPLSNQNILIDLNNTAKEFSFTELKENKNLLFANSINSLEKQFDKKYNLKLENSLEDIFILKLSTKKPVEIYKEFERSFIDSEPFVFIIINNDPNIQKIAISYNGDAFSTPDVAMNRLAKGMDHNLKQYGLTIVTEAIFNETEIWNTINIHRTTIQKIRIKYIKPNLEDISKSLDEAFKKFSEDVNSQVSIIEFSAPTNSFLENIDENNDTLKGMVSYAANGGGSVSVKIKGYRSITSDDSPKQISIEEVEFDGKAEDIALIVKDVLK